MSKGRRKKTLRDLTKTDLTINEGYTLSKAFRLKTHPTAVAIIGAEMVEHELDLLINKRLRKKDKATWFSLVEDVGPLSTFHRKIALANAMSMFDEKIRHDLTIIKRIRNTFAHNRKLINFSDETIIEEIQSSKLLLKRQRDPIGGTKGHRAELATILYGIICYRIANALSKKRTGRVKKLKKRSILAQLLDMSPDELARLQSGPQSVPQNQSDGPTPAKSPSRMGDIFGYTPPKREHL